MVRPFDVCIRGAGIVGRTLALHLAAMRLRVALCVPASAPEAADVRAYALNMPARTLLEAVRCWPAEPDITPVLGMQVFADGAGQVVFTAADQKAEALNWIVDVPELERMLADAVGFQPRIAVLTTPPPATLTIVCEGRTSSTRNAWGVDFDVTPYPQSALAARVQCENAHGQVARQWFCQGEILALLPLGGAGAKQCAVVWSVSPQRAHALQNMLPDDFCAALAAASQHSLGGISLTSERKVWPLQHAQARRWSGSNADGAWVLAGDAAHNIHPLAGQGLNIGLGDAAALVHILAQRPYWRSVGDARLLRQYERSRKAEFALMGLANDTLQQLFTQANPLLQTLRNWGMNRFNHTPTLKNQIARRAMGST